MEDLKQKLLELTHRKRMNREVREVLLEAHRRLAALEGMTPYFADGRDWTSINADEHGECYTLVRLVRDGIVRVVTVNPGDRLFIGRSK